MTGLQAPASAFEGDVGPMPPGRPRADTMGMAVPIYYTADMVRALPEDGNRYEVVHGELLVTPVPRATHQMLVLRLGAALLAYLEENPVGVALLAPADISWGRADVLVQPDVFVVPLEEARTLDWNRMRRLLLVAEVSSPSTARADRFVKRRRYQEADVPLYWLVDPDARQVEVWTPELEFPHVERESLAWHPPDAARPFGLSLKELFRPL